MEGKRLWWTDGQRDGGAQKWGTFLPFMNAQQALLVPTHNTNTHSHTARTGKGSRQRYSSSSGPRRNGAILGGPGNNKPDRTPNDAIVAIVAPSLAPPAIHPPSHLPLRWIGTVGCPVGTQIRPAGHNYLDSSWRPKPAAFHGLLLCSRVIYAEAAALLYSANRFVLHYDHAHPEPLQPLHALTASSVASLTRLTIVLNQASCHHHDQYIGYPFCCLQGRERGNIFDGAYHCRLNHDIAHHPPLLSPASEGDGGDALAAAETVLSKWHSAAACLSFVTSGRLELGLVCDIDPRHKAALDIAMSATAPLRLVPRLKDCCIQLCKTPDPRLGLIAQETVFQARGIPPPSYSKPSTRATLTSLPRELRLRILEYTDLIVPTREVIWSRRDQGYMALSSDSTDLRDYRYRRQFFHCWQTGTGCFCRRRHAAFSLTCKCWAPPGPALFLICRTLLQDAQLVFFSSNRFIINDYRSSPPSALPLLDEITDEDASLPIYEYPHDRLAASHFLRDVIPAHCLAYLRFLELVFPPYLPPSWPQTHTPAMQDWWATVDWLQDKVNAPGLTLRLVVAQPRGEITFDMYRRLTTQSEGHLVSKSYSRLVCPLTLLVNKGLAGFYAKVVFSESWTKDFREYPTANSWDDWVKLGTRDTKRRIERFVMGSRYESMYANNKAEPAASHWAYWYRQV